jgi:hypothetical protein
VKRRNKSGCVCILNDYDEFESICAAHEWWHDERMKRLREYAISHKGEPLMADRVLEIMDEKEGEK